MSQQELQMAGQLVGATSGPCHPSDYQDTYADRVNELIEAKRTKKQFRAENQAPTETNVST